MGRQSCNRWSWALWPRQPTKKCQLCCQQDQQHQHQEKDHEKVPPPTTTTTTLPPPSWQREPSWNLRTGWWWCQSNIGTRESATSPTSLWYQVWTLATGRFSSTSTAAATRLVSSTALMAGLYSRDLATTPWTWSMLWWRGEGTRCRAAHSNEHFRTFITKMISLLLSTTWVRRRLFEELTQCPQAGSWWRRKASAEVGACWKVWPSCLRTQEVFRNPRPLPSTSRISQGRRATQDRRRTWDKYQSRILL